MKITPEIEKSVRDYLIRSKRPHLPQGFLETHAVECLVAEIDRLRQLNQRQRARCDMMVESTLKLYTVTKEMKHAFEKGEEPEDYIGKHIPRG